MIRIKILLFLVLGVSQILVAQEHDQEKNFTKESGLEFVLSGLSIYNTENKASDFATEIHLTYWTSHQWAFGAGYTIIFEEHNQIGHEIAGLVSYKPWSFLTVNGGPSFSLPNSHKNTEVSAYLESEFAFKLGNFHTGPTIGALMGKEFKVFSGWHFSYEF